MTTAYFAPAGSPLRDMRSRFTAGWTLNCIVRALSLAVVQLVIGGVFADAFSAESQSTAVPFAALHIYYISPRGNDRNTGTSPSTAWASPHHNVHCGDVIIAEPGTYPLNEYGTVFAGTSPFGTVSDCPSKSGGVDGTGGIYFAIVLCAGPSLTSCNIPGEGSPSFRVNELNWAIEGFFTTQNADFGNGCMLATSDTKNTLHHIAFINNIASTCGVDGFGTFHWGAGGVDQSAVVGAIAYNASPSVGNSICGSGVSMIPTNGPDTSSGTHVFVAGVFAYKNINAPFGAGCNTDGEGIIFDSWSCDPGVRGYEHQGVVEQSAMWMNGNSGFAVFPNCLKNGDNAQVYVFNNTSYANEQDPKHAFAGAELVLNQVAPTPGDSYYSVFNNIFEATQSTSGNNLNTPVYAVSVYLNNANTSLVSAKDNYFWQSNPRPKGKYFWQADPSTTTTVGNPNTDVQVNGVHDTTSFPFGTNTYNNPGFADPDGLPTTAPICDSYTNTTACMNERYKVAANLKPRVTAGYGYEPPGPCKPDPYFPTWLKGVVFLQWNGSTLTENSGLITKPCNM